MSSDSIRVSGGRVTEDAGGDFEMSFYQSLARKGVFTILDRVRRGSITLEQVDDTFRFGSGQPHARVTIRDPAAYKAFLHGGDIGAARAYMDGHWEVDDLTALVRIFVRNRALFREKKPWYAWVLHPFQKLVHRYRRNTLEKSRDNVRAHYDLGNNFFRQFLDATMNYSCAVFESDTDSLEEASRRKMNVICRKLGLSEDDHLLEIGTGWGAMACYAAREFGCRVTTTTLSQEQVEYSRERTRKEGVDDRVTVLNRDYRELEGTFDKLVSVEMIEAVGHQYFNTFFEKCKSLLCRDGTMVLQAITMNGYLYEDYRDSTDFIRHFIFPGGCLPSVDAMTESLAEVTDFSLGHVESLGVDYVRTLRAWRRRFQDHREDIAQMGFGERFQRMWEFYLCYCEGGFEEGMIDNHQLVLNRPGA